MTLNGVIAVILRYFIEFWQPPGRTAQKFTFAISCPDEFLSFRLMAAIFSLVQNELESRLWLL